MRTDQAFREELRRQLLTEELLGLPAAVRELAEAQRRTEERLQQLTERLDRLTGRLDRLTEDIRTLVRWQRGGAGRRDGERFEREVVRRAPRLTEQLRAALSDLLPAEEDPLLADLVWWKGDDVAVVEASLQVNGNDLARAAARASTLARSGARAGRRRRRQVGPRPTPRGTPGPSG